MAQLYDTLGDGQFRLLSINNSTGTELTLRTYDIDQAPSFIALSYTWDSKNLCQQHEPRHAVSINDRQLEVRPNLHDALRNLAVPIQRQQCLLWADALCINQADTQERSIQVRKMREIYEKASYIFSWLGLCRHEHETRQAIKLMKKLDVHVRGVWTERNQEMAEAKYRTMKATASVFWKNRKALRGIFDMFTRTYWQRTWIHQEVTTPTNILFWCGPYSFDESYFSSAGFFLTEPGFQGGANNHMAMQIPNMLCAIEKSDARCNRRKMKQRRLIDLLYEVRPTFCTDPRDKVICLLGHAADVTVDELSIDYSQSLADIYVNVAKCYVSHKVNPNLDFLGYVFTTFEGMIDPSIPSWVPDWERQTGILPFHGGDSHRPTYYLYDPCPGTRVEGCITNGTLELMGIVMEDFGIEDFAEWDNRAAFEDCAKSTTPIRWRRKFFDHFRRIVSDYKADTWPIVTDFHKVQQAQHKFAHDMAEATFGERHCPCRLRALLTNKSVAVVPGGSQLGDRIALFHGGRALYVLRPIPEQANTYRFIGECYVDGLMNGALMEMNAQRGITASLIRMV